MTPLVWATIALCAVAALLIVGIPYWITFMRPNRTPDHSEADADARRHRFRLGSGPIRRTRGRRLGLSRQTVRHGRSRFARRDHAGRAFISLTQFAPDGQQPAKASVTGRCREPDRRA